MELREFAEQVLFATTLEDKLRCPVGIVDTQPGAPLESAPAMPGRPRELVFKPSGTGKSEFPKKRFLDRNDERGRLLHFFANHELLATELMALVLLRFPAAPPAFRRGVLETLKDEQNHTRLYLARMKQSGVEFGAIPVSGYFWRAVSPMTTPMDYVAGLSLTFEQANLDFCRQFTKEFETVGDLETARLLQNIYQDEIAHVAHGLKWFRRWKQPGQSDWDAFCAQLKYPLSPNRAKGPWFQADGRQEAGLDNSFIENLSVFAQSKGRTPRVYVFNPFAEEYIAKGPGFTPSRPQAILRRDLEILPLFLCKQDDVALMNELPSTAFLSRLKEAGFQLPELALSQDCSDPTSPLARRKLGGLRPWAWGPESAKLLAPLAANVVGGVEGTPLTALENIKKFYSKAWSADLLRRLVSSKDSPPWFCSELEAGLAVNTIDEALAAIAAIRARGHHRVVAKESFGLAGHNMIRLWEPDLQSGQKRWMERAMGQGHPLVIEPWLDRVMDFSIQLEMEPRGIGIVGFTGLQNDLRGQFHSNWAEPNHARSVPASVLRWLHPQVRDAGEIHRCLHQAVVMLEKEFRAAGFQGPAGIDALIFKTARGEFKLKPIVEINPRHTLGRLTLELMRQACPGSSGLFRLTNRPSMNAKGFDTFDTFARRVRKQFPIVLEGHPRPRIREGIVVLNDPARAEGFLATLQIGKRLHLMESEGWAEGERKQPGNHGLVSTSRDT